MGFFASLGNIIELVKFIKWLITSVMGLLKEIDERKAAKKKEELSKALDQLEKAKTKEEQRNAIKDVTRNSF